MQFDLYEYSNYALKPNMTVINGQVAEYHN